MPGKSVKLFTGHYTRGIPGQSMRSRPVAWERSHGAWRRQTMRLPTRQCDDGLGNIDALAHLPPGGLGQPMEDEAEQDQGEPSHCHHGESPTASPRGRPALFCPWCHCANSRIPALRGMSLIAQMGGQPGRQGSLPQPFGNRRKNSMLGQRISGRD